MCNSIDKKFDEVCSKIEGGRFCDFCAGTSGLDRQKEEKYLYLKAKELGISIEGSGDDPSLPGALTQIKNFAGSFINHAVGGFKQAPDEVVQARKAICQGCDKLRKADNRCSACGCFIDIKTKWAGEKCPLDKWGAVSSGGCGGCGKK